jgi:dienelactone hydrolase
MSAANEGYKHLGPFSDWVVTARARRELWAAPVPGMATQAAVREALGFATAEETPRELRVERRWERDGVAGEALSWSVGYGPRTQAWLLRPAGVTGPLPGVVALHDHGGYKWYGREKIADGPDGMPPELAAFRAKYYGGRAYANELARRGYAVLVPDTFLWGSRKFPLSAMPGPLRALVAASRTLWEPTDSTPIEIAEYNAAAGHHELILEKYCALLGTTLAGVVSYEDRVAVNYLRGRDDVIADRIGAVGLSGGGNRAGLLAGSGAPLAATVVVGLMSTYEGLLDHNVAGHTWMFFPHGWSRHGDWPDLVAAAAPMPLLVQYDLDDHLFTREGMEAAHARLAALYERAGASDAYAGQFYPGPHQFDLPMQEAAFSWLAARLGR